VTTNGFNGASYSVSQYTAAVSFDVRFPVRMRAAPSITLYSPVSGATAAAYDLTGATDVTVSGATAVGQSGFGANTSGTVSGFHSLFLHYAATAEL
jgi:hypothetical protein